MTQIWFFFFVDVTNLTHHIVTPMTVYWKLSTKMQSHYSCSYNIVYATIKIRSCRFITFINFSSYYNRNFWSVAGIIQCLTMTLEIKFVLLKSALDWVIKMILCPQNLNEIRKIDRSDIYSHRNQAKQIQQELTFSLIKIKIEMMGLMFGARGAITPLFESCRKSFQLSKSIIGWIEVNNILYVHSWTNIELRTSLKANSDKCK